MDFYLGELMKVLHAMGVRKFDIIPEWAKPMIKFVLEMEGISVLK